MGIHRFMSTEANRLNSRLNVNKDATSYYVFLHRSISDTFQEN